MYIVHCSYTLTDGHTAAAAAGNLKPLFFCLLSMYMYMYIVHVVFSLFVQYIYMYVSKMHLRVCGTFMTDTVNMYMCKYCT